MNVTNHLWDLTSVSSETEVNIAAISSFAYPQEWPVNTSKVAKHPAVDSRTPLIEIRQHKMLTVSIYGKPGPKNRYGQRIMEEVRS